MWPEGATPRGRISIFAILVATTGVLWSGCGDDDDAPPETPVEAEAPSDGTGEAQAKAKDKRPADRSDRRDEQKDGKRREAGSGGRRLDEGRLQALREFAQQSQQSQGGGSPEEIRERIETAKEQIKRLGGQNFLDQLRKRQRERQEQQRKEGAREEREEPEAEDREGADADGE